MKRAAAIIGVILVSTLLFGVPVWAGCRWTWDCSTGRCYQVQVCDGPLDLPAIRPPEIPPIPPPTIRPIPQPTIPPLGTTGCRQAYLCNSLGRCRWETVCQ